MDRILLATRTLDRTVDFVKDCNHKAMFILTVDTAFMLPFLYTVEFKSFTRGYTLAVVVGMVALISMVFGIVSSLCALKAMVDKSSSRQTNIFFGDITKCKNETIYTYSFQSESDDELLEDTLEQIYINSCIAMKKTVLYNRAANATHLGVVLMVLYLLICHI